MVNCPACGSWLTEGTSRCPQCGAMFHSARPWGIPPVYPAAESPPRQSSQWWIAVLLGLLAMCLAVGVLILARGPTKRQTNDQEAMSMLRNALLAEKVFYVDTGIYTSSPSDLATLENSFMCQPAVTISKTNCEAEEGWVCVWVVDVGTYSAQAVNLGTHASSGRNYYLGDTAIGAYAGTHYACSRESIDITLAPISVRDAIQDDAAWGRCS